MPLFLVSMYGRLILSWLDSVTWSIVRRIYKKLQPYSENIELPQRVGLGASLLVELLIIKKVSGFHSFVKYCEFAPFIEYLAPNPDDHWAIAYYVKKLYCFLLQLAFGIKLILLEFLKPLYQHIAIKYRIDGTRFIKQLVPLASLAIILLYPFHASALTAGAPSVNVLELPNVEIIGMDQTTGIVTIAPPKIDPEISAELQAVVSVYDGDRHLETSKVAISDPTENIRIPIKTHLQTGYTVSSRLINHDIESSKVDDSFSEAPPTEPEPTPEPTPTEPPAPIIIYENDSSGDNNTVYVIKEVKPDKVIIEKTKEVIKPVIQEKVTTIVAPTIGQAIKAESKDSDSLTHAIIRPSEQNVAPNVSVTPVNPDISGHSLTEKIVFSLLIILCITLLVIISLMLRKLMKKKVIAPTKTIDTTKPIKSTLSQENKKKIYAYFLATVILIGSYFNFLPKKLKKYQISKVNKKNVSLTLSIFKTKSSTQDFLSAAELKSIFELHGHMYDQDESLLPEKILSVFEMYNRAYQSYKADKKLQA